MWRAMTPTPEQIEKLPKWAKSWLAEVIEDAVLKSALRWPDEPKPVPVDVRKELEGPLFSTLYVGWWAHTYQDQYQVGQGCSNGVHHSSRRTDGTDSQGAGRFFRTKREALLFARWELCERFAKTLSRLLKENEKL